MTLPTSLTRRNFIKASLMGSVTLAVSPLISTAIASSGSIQISPGLVREAGGEDQGTCPAHPAGPRGHAVQKVRRLFVPETGKHAVHRRFQGEGARSTKCPPSPPGERSRGVVAASSGNHAQAVAYHATRLGIPSVIVMPKVTPQIKIRRTLSLGGEVIVHGAEFDDSLDFALKKAKEDGLTFIHPFNDPLVIAGQGTVGLEIMQDFPQGRDSAGAGGWRRSRGRVRNRGQGPEPQAEGVWR